MADGGTRKGQNNIIKKGKKREKKENRGFCYGLNWQMAVIEGVVIEGVVIEGLYYSIPLFRRVSRTKLKLAPPALSALPSHPTQQNCPDLGQFLFFISIIIKIYLKICVSFQKKRDFTVYPEAAKRPKLN